MSQFEMKMAEPWIRVGIDLINVSTGDLEAELRRRRLDEEAATAVLAMLDDPDLDIRFVSERQQRAVAQTSRTHARIIAALRSEFGTEFGTESKARVDKRPPLVLTPGGPWCVDSDA